MCQQICSRMCIVHEDAEQQSQALTRERNAPYLGAACVEQRAEDREADARRAEHERGAIQQRQQVRRAGQRLANMSTKYSLWNKGINWS